MSNHVEEKKPLPPISFDPQQLSSFGPPPDHTLKEQPHLNERRGFSSFVGSFFGSFKQQTKAKQQQQPQQQQQQQQGQTLDKPEGQGEGLERKLSGRREYLPFSSKLPPPAESPTTNKPTLPILGLKTIWAKDETCHHCYACSTKFSPFNRRHHCRFCGRIFCDDCSSYRIPGQPFGTDGKPC